MNKSRGGLGRGLAALIPTGPQTDVVSDVLMGGSVQKEEPDDRTSGQQRGLQSHRGGQVANRFATGTDPAFALSVRAVGETPLTGAVDGPAVNGNASGGTHRGGSAETGDAFRPAVAPIGQTAGAEGPRYEEVPIDKIRPNPRNPRTVFDEDALGELAHSMREFGLLQPIVVREVSGGYELVMGERRWRAAQRAGLNAIPAIIRRTEDAALLRDALLENIHRANLNPLEEAAAYQQLLQEFDVTQEELAVRIGRSRPVISNTIRLLRLPLPVQRRVAAGVLSAGHARALLSLPDPSDQEELATRVVAEGLSVRGTEEAVILMAGRSMRPKRSVGKKTVMPDLTALAGRLSDTFDTRVRVELGRQKGRVIVEFATVDDLERIVGIMAPETLNARRKPGATLE